LNSVKTEKRLKESKRKATCGVERIKRMSAEGWKAMKTGMGGLEAWFLEG